MKKITLLLGAVLFFSVLNAQKVYFIYLQSENQQPFFAKIGERVYNSSSSGYLILSKLRDSIYNFNIGFQGSQLADQPFSVVVNKKDQGFLIKNFSEVGCQLFNLQTMALIKPNSTAIIQNKNTVKTEKRESNAFTDLLAKAADDSTIKEKSIIVKAEEKKTEEAKLLVKDTVSLRTEDVNKESKKEDSILNVIEPIKNKIDSTEKKIIGKDTLNAFKTETIKEDIKEEAAPKFEDTKNIPQQGKEVVIENKAGEVPYNKSKVIRYSESSTTEGFGITFFDIYSDGKADTIRILIPPITSKIFENEVKPQEKKFLEISTNDSSLKQTENSSSNPIISNGAGLKKNNCSLIANDDDFFKLRKKMAAESRDDNMIDEARKVFKNKCFNTQQIRNLSTLFLSNEGKYKFLDAAYNYVSDVKNYASLQSELTDEYYINRFKVMLH